MEIFALLETLEDILERSRTVPFTEKSIIEKDQFLDIIKEIRLKLPDELKQAKWIKEERERISAGGVGYPPPFGDENGLHRHRPDYGRRLPGGLFLPGRAQRRAAGHRLAVFRRG